MKQRIAAPLGVELQSKPFDKLVETRRVQNLAQLLVEQDTRETWPTPGCSLQRPFRRLHFGAFEK